MAKRLTRSTQEKMLAGVCSGFAKYLEWDPVWVRLVFLILLFTSIGTMALIYLILIFVMPRDDRSPGS